MLIEERIQKHDGTLFRLKYWAFSLPEEIAYIEENRYLFISGGFFF